MTARPSCCRCDPARCDDWPTDEHACADAGCALCVDGCPAAMPQECCTTDAALAAFFNLAEDVT